MNKAKIIIVDDHPVFRDGLASHINSLDDIEICGETDNTAKAMELIRRLKPDMLIIDITLKESNGFELIKDINMCYTNLAILVLSMHDEVLYAERVIKAGAGGYIMKQDPPEKIIEAIRKVLNGKIYLSERMMDRILANISKKTNSLLTITIRDLSDREFEIFQSIGYGLELRDIAEKLNLSIKTVQNYREHIKEKLKLRGNTELIQYAYQWIQSQGKINVDFNELNI